MNQHDQDSIMLACGIALALDVHQFSIEDGIWKDFSPSEGMTPTMGM